MRISDWSSDVCSSDLLDPGRSGEPPGGCGAAGGRKAGRRRDEGTARHPPGHLCLWGRPEAQGLPVEGRRRAHAYARPRPRAGAPGGAGAPERNSDGWGKGVSVRVELVGRRLLKKKKTKHTK